MTRLLSPFSLIFGSLLLGMFVGPLLAADPESGFESLFDGKELKGWDGNPKFWRVEDGTITGQTTADNPTNGNTFLIWRGVGNDAKAEVADFELRLQFKIVGGNSGIQYRSKDHGNWVVGGYQGDFEAGKTYSGILYEERGRGILAQRGEMTSIEPTADGKHEVMVVGSLGPSDDIQKGIKPEAWNDYKIIAKGNQLTHVINGRVTVTVTDNDAAHAAQSGILALQLHAGPPMKVQFKDIRIRHFQRPASNAAGAVEKKKIVFIAGGPSHGWGSHEHYAGCRLLAKHLQDSLPSFTCEVIQNGWPRDGVKSLAGADAVVVYCDGGGGHLLNPHLAEFQTLMDQGVGLACLHYAVEVPKGEPGDAFLKWIGGYFETHWSVNPHWTAKFSSFPNHPISRGVLPFAINDEWYFHMRFAKDMRGVTPILSAVAPAETMSRTDGPHSGNPDVRKAVAAGERQHVAWAFERPGGGRGFGFTGGHVHWNWGDENFRKLALNAIVWIAHGEVPAQGVSSKNPTQDELEANQDEPKPKGEKKTSVIKRPSNLNISSLPTQTRLIAAGGDAGSHDPKTAVANLDVHPQLKATLFAAEPLLLSPSNIDVDHRGRVWVCEVINYRQHKDRRPEGDRILILEDTNGDGMLDDQKVFYQGRDIDSPHGVCVLGNRIIVSASDKVTVLYDEDQNDRADKKEVMYSGISGVQHDHGIHAFVFGPDGKLYFNFGNEGHQLKDGKGQPVKDKAGNLVQATRQPYQEGMVFRQNLDGTELETLGWNFRNNWMVCVDSFGTIWQSDNDDDGNRGVRINFVMEFGNYGYKDEFTGAGWNEHRTGIEELPERHWHLNDPGVIPNLLHTGGGSPTGIAVYEGDLLPESFHGQLIHCDAGPSVTRAYFVSDQGAGYQAEIVNILAGTRDPWFRPSDVKVAPDGSLIVADWYDPGVGGHQMGDLDRGRIFRVVPQEHSGNYAIPQFDWNSPAGAVAALRNPNNSVRYLAWTALHKMGAQAEPELLKLWADPNPRMQARALWLLGKIPGKGAHYVNRAIEHRDANLRITGLRLARQLSGISAEEVVAKLVRDPSPAVRRECAIALRHLSTEQAASLWAELAQQHDGKDRWYLEALGIGADQQWDRFLAAWMKRVQGKWDTPAGRDIVWRSRGTATPEHLLTTIEKTTDVKELSRYFRALDFLPATQRDQVVSRLALGTPIDDSARSRFVTTESVRRVSPQSMKDHPEYGKKLSKVLDQLRGTSEFVDLVNRFDVRDRYPELLQLAQQDPSGQLGVEAIRTLMGRGQKDLIQKELGNSKREIVEQTLLALGNSSDNHAVDLLRDYVSHADHDLELRRNAVRAQAKIHRGARELLEQVKAHQLDEVFTAVVAAELTTSRFGEIRNVALKLFPSAPSKEAKPLPPIHDLAGMNGDADRGMTVFQQAGTCAKCHIVRGQGKEVGPNLSEIGDKLSREAMFESILFPSAGISHNYEAYTLVTTDGDVVNGLLKSESESEVVITTEDGISRPYPRSKVDSLRRQTVSLMPADLQKLMTQAELVDVVAYLQTLKK